MNRNVAYFMFSGLFLAEVFLAGSHIEQVANAPVIFWILGSLTVFHLARVISFSGVASWLRGPFTEVVEDTSGAGDSVEPRRGNVIGELLACPVCTGSHVAGVLVAVYAYQPALALALAVIGGLAGAGQLFHWLTEVLEWAGRNQRESAGTAHLLKTRGYVRAAYCDDQTGEMEVVTIRRPVTKQNKQHVAGSVPVVVK